MRKICSFVIALVLVASQPSRAAPFVNLDFEQAVVTGFVPPHFIEAAPAFPGWTPRIGGVIQPLVTYNSPGIGTAVLALYDQPAMDIGISLLQGQYMAVLVPESGTGTVPSLTQNGDIPADARSLRFLGPGDRGAADIYLNGERLVVIKLSGGSNPFDIATFGADVTTFAGLSNLDLRVDSGSNLTGIDGLIFSSIPVPEPASSATAIAFILANARRSRLRPRRRGWRLRGAAR